MNEKQSDLINLLISFRARKIKPTTWRQWNKQEIDKQCGAYHNSAHTEPANNYYDKMICVPNTAISKQSVTFFYSLKRLGFQN